MARVAVFIDWQNAYQQAREAFGLTGPGHEGQFSPLGLGKLLAARNRRGNDGRLVRVEVHRGQPLPNVDPIGHAAVALQARACQTRSQHDIYLETLHHGKESGRASGRWVYGL